MRRVLSANTSEYRNSSEKGRHTEGSDVNGNRNSRKDGIGRVAI
jgi:hypothetical protein